MIKYSEKIESTELLGPGERAVLWVYGCCFDCPGCIATNFKQGSYLEASEEELSEWFLTSGMSDITISGGEPMLQAEALAKMLRMIREKREIGVIVYSGFVYEDLLKRAKEEQGIEAFLAEIDLLIDGPYMEEKNDNQPFRGSANQRIIPLTDRYIDKIDAYYHHTNGRQVEVRLSGEKTLMVGVPSKDQAAIWDRIKALSEPTEA